MRDNTSHVNILPCIPHFSNRLYCYPQCNHQYKWNRSTILHWSLSEIWLARRERCLLHMWYLQLSSSLDVLGGKLCAAIEAGSPRGSALITNKVYLLPTTATTTRHSVFDPCLPSLCGPIMKVRMTIHTQSHIVFTKPTQTYVIIQYRKWGHTKTLANTLCHRTNCPL